MISDPRSAGQRLRSDVCLREVGRLFVCCCCLWQRVEELRAGADLSSAVAAVSGMAADLLQISAQAGRGRSHLVISCDN